MGSRLTSNTFDRNIQISGQKLLKTHCLPFCCKDDDMLNLCTVRAAAWHGATWRVPLAHKSHLEPAAFPPGLSQSPASGNTRLWGYTELRGAVPSSAIDAPVPCGLRRDGAGERGVRAAGAALHGSGSRDWKRRRK